MIFLEAKKTEKTIFAHCRNENRKRSIPGTKSVQGADTSIFKNALHGSMHKNIGELEWSEIFVGLRQLL